VQNSGNNNKQLNFGAVAQLGEHLACLATEKLIVQMPELEQSVAF
jgi:hypothetical protein